MPDFVHLHLHSEYSLLDGACRTAEIPRLAREMGHTAVALTDHGVMYGAVDFYLACKREGVKPIIGCEVYVAPGSRFDREGRGAGPSHLVLLCKNKTGYKNLIRMVSLAWTEGFYSKPRVDMELLRRYSDGLIALSACLSGSIPKSIIAGNFEGARAEAERMAEIFGRDSFYLELQDHKIDEQRQVNAALIKIAEETGIGLVATNDVHYLRRADADTQAILMCIGMNTVITDGRPLGFEDDEFYYKSTAEMERLFGKIDGGSPITNTVKIADMCSLELDFDKIYMPRFPFTNGVDPTVFLTEKTEAGLLDRVGRGHIVYDDKYTEADYRERIEYELSVITGMGYSEYYLIVADFIEYAKSHGIPVGPGRGSGAGSLVAYLIGITDIDPLRFGLLFERFLNPERVSLPDFDVDFSYERRDEVIEYVREKYGAEHVAQIITFGTMAARAAVRDVGRALGMSYADTDNIARLIPRALDVTLEDAMKGEELSELYKSSPSVRRVIDTARAIEGMPRHASTHAAGVVITSEPLYDIVPLAKNGGTVVTQFDMNTVAKVGLVKFDFLALRYIAIIANTVARIREREPDFDIALIPGDDPETMAMISAGDTNGVFQLESAGMKRMLTQLLPENLRDTIAAIALFRPGPMDSIPQYIAVKNGNAEPKYKTPEMQDILRETYGCIVYQEQVMQIFRAVAGYSYARADVVRRAMSKKKAEALEAERGDFLRGAVEHGMTEAEASELFDDMASFSSYAYNKSHAAAYAVISYETAYLKRHYKKEYFASLLDSVLGSEGKTAEYIAECERGGIAVLPPDINESRADYTVGESGIRYGLAALKGLGRQFIDEITDERTRGGDFTSFYDFARRMSEYDLNRRQVEALIKSGALDRLGTRRSQLLAVYDLILDDLHDKKRRGVTGQLDMFSSGSGGEASEGAAEFDYPDIPELPRQRLLELEKEVSGMYFSGHILDDYEDACAKAPHTPIVEIVGDAPSEDGENETEPDRTHLDRERVSLIGIITKRTVKETKRGDKMMFFTLQDKTGEIEVIVFPRMLSRYAPYLTAETPFYVTGELSVEDDKTPKLLLSELSTLTERAALSDEAAEKTPPRADITAKGKVPAESRRDAISGRENEPVFRTETNPLSAPATSIPTPGRIYLRVPSADSVECRRAEALIEIFSGPVAVFIYDRETEKYERFTRSGADGTCGRLMRELKTLLGEDNVAVR